ncbi:hypothetical protein EAD89_20860 [Micromonospora sp. BL4]|uniref:hypothetical protein n=1 Tax=Micromonospora sp. BL4 TaxID=2478710 RepID=UPI000EF5F533|nr:hypothetical protein [Micromonospora sp. BL4]RLP86742.1 hypothetical protein EAD89_20860 [Micromonospora sp. BL4]
MVTRTPGGVDAPRARLGRGLLAVAFALLAYFGVTAPEHPAQGFGLSWSIIGTAGAVGVLASMLAARRWSRTGVPARQRAALRVEAGARLLMALAAPAALAVGVASAPDGAERGFVVAVTAVLAGSLALYALVADDLRRAARGGA